MPCLTFKAQHQEHCDFANDIDLSGCQVSEKPAISCQHTFLIILNISAMEFAEKLIEIFLP